MIPLRDVIVSKPVRGTLQSKICPKIITLLSLLHSFDRVRRPLMLLHPCEMIECGLLVRSIVLLHHSASDP
ncbi:MAG: hypothetical protein ACK55Z_36050 [bacterium]